LPVCPGFRKIRNMSKDEKKIEKKKKEKKGEEVPELVAPKPEKGIETMFRITSSNNQRLSDMADKKAHILITVNAIILSAIISLVLRKLDESSYLTIPTIILLTICLGSMVVSLQATRPAVFHGYFTEAEMQNKEVNLLFFGNFYRMELDAYISGMYTVMGDTEFLHNTLIRDVYGQGVVLGKKYGLLRQAYNIFMYGLIVAVISFIAAAVIHSNSVTDIRTEKPAAAIYYK
jgi:hypothetical protein